MTNKQVELLQLLIAADRLYHSRQKAGELVHRDERGVEIGWINGVNPRTADALVNLGLAEIVNIRTSQNWIFLHSYNPYDDI